MAGIEQWAEDTVAAALKPLTGGRVYPLKIPQGAKLPCITFQRQSGNPRMTLRGYSSESVVMLVNVFAKTYEVAKSAALEARAALAPFAALRFDRDIYHEEADAYCVSMEFICNQIGGFCK